ncbi:ABC transporter ATP-binding protein [Cumulibacter manganitolerans]|uniref:ABC transporter ATP-binding protein n=1 Tax=Cumulibacter manganitolerans TaxID=1884992 RepID=UPI001297934C|nr:ABC transporter ATP-binding protein [Cumulibacter manganitolerans]
MTTVMAEGCRLQAEGVTVRFGGLTAVRDVTMSIDPGTVLGLIGPNGAGKTTLVNVLSGLIQPTEGRVLFNGEAHRWTLSRAARIGVARTFQASTVFSEFTVIENVAIGGLNSRREVDAHAVLSKVRLEHRALDVAGSLSFGELRRLGVAIALSTAPKVLLLDEPGAGMTGADLDTLGELIRSICEDGTSVLLVDHNMRFLMSTVDHVVALESGQMIAEGSPAEIQSNERVRASYLGSSHEPTR